MGTRSKKTTNPNVGCIKPRSVDEGLHKIHHLLQHTFPRGRSLVDRSEVVQGGNRQVTFTYEFVVDNFKQTPVRLVLRDRTPNTGDIDTLRVALGEMSHPLSQDPDYQRFDKPKGLLMWDLEIKPGAGPSATTLRYAYSAEYDKNLTLQDIGDPEKERVREEFMQKARATKGL